MHLQTDRLWIRKFQKEDETSVFTYTSDSKVMKYIPEGPFTKQGAADFIAENSGESPEHFAVATIEENVLIGHITFFKYFGTHTYEIGWVFNPDFYNRGFATEAAQGVLDYGFEKMDLHRIIATCQPDNIASYRIMEKIGMRKEGYHKQCIPNGDDWWDEVYYAVLKDEWEEAQRLKK
ncbi:GNAT family N-acetyltransferase [Thalassobacillus hwangdonensis]|uniref:GNAT family N-acetyltransferase n=1 Tax=Thalassobacillus hwangdonensis TaxID=546108 RepID=A0ABW3L3L3_9BACI